MMQFVSDLEHVSLSVAPAGYKYNHTKLCLDCTLKAYNTRCNYTLLKKYKIRLEINQFIKSSPIILSCKEKATTTATPPLPQLLNNQGLPTLFRTCVQQTCIQQNMTYTHWHCDTDSDLKTKQSCTYLAELLVLMQNSAPVWHCDR